jgi:hypothetical protein
VLLWRVRPVRPVRLGPLGRLLMLLRLFGALVVMPVLLAVPLVLPLAGPLVLPPSSLPMPMLLAPPPSLPAPVLPVLVLVLVPVPPPRLALLTLLVLVLALLLAMLRLLVPGAALQVSPRLLTPFLVSPRTPPVLVPRLARPVLLVPVPAPALQVLPPLLVPPPAPQAIPVLLPLVPVPPLLVRPLVLRVLPRLVLLARRPRRTCRRRRKPHGRLALPWVLARPLQRRAQPPVHQPPHPPRRRSQWSRPLPCSAFRQWVGLRRCPLPRIRTRLRKLPARCLHSATLLRLHLPAGRLPHPNRPLPPDLKRTRRLLQPCRSRHLKSSCLIYPWS